MKGVEQQAQPVCMSSFFFEQLASLISDHPSQESEPTSATVHPSFVTASNKISRVLWDFMAPASYREDVMSFLQDEHHRTQELKSEVGEAWLRVEKLIAQNKIRRAFLDEERIYEQLQGVQSMCFWAAEDIARRFKLDVSIGKEDESHLTALKEARITLDFSVLPRNAPNELAEVPDPGHVSSGLATPLPSVNESDTPVLACRARVARRLSDKTLMNPSKRPYCIRRLFSPILQKRDKLPKHFTRFLNDLQQIQSNKLPSIEAMLQSSILFNTPLHVPFQVIAQFITRDLTLPNTFEAMEGKLVEQYDFVKGSVDQLCEFLETASSNPTNIDLLGEEERSAMARQMWDLLFKELEAHKEGYRSIHEGYTELTVAATEHFDKLSTHLDNTAALARQSMEQMQADAALCVEAIERSGSQIVNLVERATSEFEKDLATLEESIRAKSFILSKSEAAQEKMARRVREVVKELYVEQAKYTRVSQELLQDQLSLAQLRASHKQLREAVATRYEMVSTAKQKSKELQQMLDAAEAAQGDLLSACRQEIERQRNDAFYRRCRVVRYAVDNVQWWSRCVGDMAYIYEARYRALDGKSKAASWQTHYLLAAEKDWAVGNLLEVRPEMTEVQKRRLEVQDMANAVEIDMPTGTLPISNSTRLTDTTSGVDQSRKLMVILDGPQRVNRAVPTLRKYKTNKNHLRGEVMDEAPVVQAVPAIADATD
ncbi:unnamed protein product [Phytomonas sp. EM1]|nr:unnamed protein product [Phytomonas sp. EM1]|eukprot:CCW64199.1 unnamed protein product [Phytomonas sp. isolate EM1]